LKLAGKAAVKGTRVIAGAVVAMRVVLAIVLVVRERAEGERASASAETWRERLIATPKGALRPDAVLSIVPHAGLNAPAPASFRISSAAKDFYNLDFASLYARLSKASRTPEENWILGQVLEYCAMIPDEVPRGTAAPSKEVADARRTRFAAALSPSDPDRERRLAAFDVATRNRCEGLPRLQSTRAEIDDLYRQGAAAGDPKSRVALVIDELRGQLKDRAGKNGTPNLPTLGDDQMAVVRQALASSDPTTEMEGARALWFGFGNVSVRDADGKAVDALALHNAAKLIACDSGYPCGPDSSEIAQSCAYMGRCDAGNLRDYFLYYRSSPYDSQVLARYESALRSAARSGDTSFLVFYPAPAPGFAAFQ